MKKLFLFALGVLPITVQVMSQIPLSSSLKEHSLLWRISGNGLTTPSYLFGTIHMICPDNYFWTAVMQNALDSTRQLCLELPMSDTDFPAKTMESLSLAKGEELKDYFSPQDFQKLSIFFQDSLGLSIANFAHFKPFLLYSLLAAKTLDCDQPIAYELKLIEKEKTRGLPIIGLETLEEQLSIFEDMPKPYLSNMIVKMADSLQAAKLQYQKMVSLYRQQQLGQLYRLIENSPDTRLLQTKLLDDRNKKWIPKIEKIMLASPTFFAVGAGHLAGINGVIALLQQRGYQVIAVK